MDRMLFSTMDNVYVQESDRLFAFFYIAPFDDLEPGLPAAAQLALN